MHINKYKDKCINYVSNENCNNEGRQKKGDKGQTN